MNVIVENKHLCYNKTLWALWGFLRYPAIVGIPLEDMHFKLRRANLIGLGLKSGVSSSPLLLIDTFVFFLVVIMSETQ